MRRSGFKSSSARKNTPMAATTEISVRRLRPDEWAVAKALRLRALQDAPDAFWVTAEQEATTSPAEWRERVGRAEAATFVASDHGADVGLAVGAPHHDRPGVAGLYAVWVAPEARGRGVGRALVGQVIAWARAAGYRSLRLVVGDANIPAQRLYADAGFAATGRTCAFLPPRDHITEHELSLEL